MADWQQPASLIWLLGCNSNVSQEALEDFAAYGSALGPDKVGPVTWHTSLLQLLVAHRLTAAVHNSPDSKRHSCCANVRRSRHLTRALCL